MHYSLCINIIGFVQTMKKILSRFSQILFSLFRYFFDLCESYIPNSVNCVQQKGIVYLRFFRFRFFQIRLIRPFKNPKIPVLIQFTHILAIIETQIES